MLFALQWRIATAASVGASLNEALATSALYVDQGNPHASDTNPGTVREPFKTIAHGVAIADGKSKSGAGTRVLIGPGAYRERVDLSGNRQEKNAPIILQAVKPGTVILLGSDVWDGWENRGDGVYTHAWPYKWGLAPYPRGWQGVVKLQDIVRRREMVFVNGMTMRQELSRNSLGPGAFFVDQDAGVVYLKPSAGSPMPGAVEVSTRSNLLRIEGKRNVVIRGLVFRHETSFIQQGGPLQILGSSNIVVDGCKLEWNSTGGPLIHSSDHITVGHTISSNNGFSGMGGYRVTNALITDVETSTNNWRGARGQFTTWDTAGAKFLLFHHVLLIGHRASGNQGPGLWLDTDNSDVVVQHGRWTHNAFDGIFIEATQGPVRVENGLIANNGGNGVVIADSTTVTLLRNTIRDNRGAQVLISGDPGGRSVQNFESGEVHANLVAADTSITLNTIVCTGQCENVFSANLGAREWRTFSASLVSDKNAWSSANGPLIFFVAGLRRDLSQWRAMTGQDAHSTFSRTSSPGPDQRAP